MTDDDYDRALDSECEADACQSCLPPRYCSECMTKLAAGFAALRSRAETAEAALAELHQQAEQMLYDLQAVLLDGHVPSQAGGDWEEALKQVVVLQNALSNAQSLVAEDPKDPFDLLKRLRVEGWSVAVHNDYRLDGAPHTFWLFTKGNECRKGEGRTDYDALLQVADQDG